MLSRVKSIFAAVCLLSTVAFAAGPSARPGYGSIPYADAGGTGVTFRVWAPNATTVGVKVSFNGWVTTSMTKEGSTGYWSADIPGAKVDNQYKYVINGNADKRDPRSRRVTNSAGNSIVYSTNAFNWAGDTAIPPAKNDLVIYEMHAGTFNAEDYVPSTFDKDILRLDYLRNLGVSAIEVMPINEFPADKSWGYNPADIFAIESALGGADAFKRFVKACHQRGIAVLVDVIHNHYGPSDLAMWQFDGWSQNGKGGIYFYNDARSSTMWGETRPDYGRTEVRDYIKDQIRMFLDECHVDGFRWDSVFNIIYYNNGGGTLPDGVSLLSEINQEIETKHPGTIRIAEDHGFDYSMNYDSVWDTAFHDHIQWQVTQSSDASRNMYWLADKLTQWPSLQRVIFSESHDAVGDLNSHHRLPRDIDSVNPTGIFARKRELLAASMVLTAPGTPMLFQGQEMHEDWTFSSSTSLRWSLTNSMKGIVRAYSDLIHARRNTLGGTPGLKGTGITAQHIDDGNKVLSFIRWDQGGQVDDVVVVANFAVKAWTNNDYLIQFPSAGTWYTWFNGDSTNYGADFGNVGSAGSVVASGSPAKAAVNMGSYSTMIFSKTPPPHAGVLSLDPLAPTGCVPVTISYTPGQGPLSNSTPIVVRIGINGWQGVADQVMTDTGTGAWTYVFAIPQETEILDMAFRNDSTNSTIWDNNLGGDWHVAISGCANQPSSASVSPSAPVGCIPFTLQYNENAGPLKNATNVFVFLGHNNWQDIASIAMTEGPNGVWTSQHSIPPETWQMDFVFNDGATTNRIWDNHNGADWHVLVAECLSAQFSGLAITNPSEDISVADSTSNLVLTGKASTDMTGNLFWTNSLTGDGGGLPASSNWITPSISLVEGANLIRISGTNSGINPNADAHDSATNAIYTTGPSWVTGQNGGTGFGAGWQLAATANAGQFLATVSPNLSMAGAAWGLWANGGGLSEATRQFAGPLHMGDVVRVRLDNNWIDGGSSIGVGLQNRFGQNLFEFLFVGGGSNYIVNDEINGRVTDVPWTGDGIDLRFELTSESGYTLTINTQELTGVLAPSSETIVSRFRAWNYSAGGGYEHDYFLDDLRVNGDPLDVSAYQDEVTVTRPFGPYSDQDDDGFMRWEEELAGTEPDDSASHLPDIPDNWTGQVLRVDLPSSAAARGYDIYVRTNLVEGDWTRCGLDALGWGGPLTLQVTNQDPSAFYRTGVFLP